VRRELKALVGVAQDAHCINADLARIKAELRLVNERLWEIEDRIRAKEAAQRFDQEFIELARSVYFQNDKRADLKRRINRLMNSGDFSCKPERPRTDVRPQTSIKLAEGLELLRQKSENTGLNRTKITNNETVFRRRDNHAAAQIPNQPQHVAIPLLDCGIVPNAHRFDGLGENLIRP
jgi:hypothetical protein